MDMHPAACAFPLEEQAVKCEPFGNGHINSTYILTTDAGKRYILQRINRAVFRDPAAVMENVAGVTDHIRAQGGCALRFLYAAPGSAWYRDAAGEYWRCYGFVEGLCLDAPRDAQDFRNSGLAFGQFQQQLASYPAHTLHETIPDFHNTPARFRQLKAAIAENRAGRLDTCREEVEFYLSQEALGSRLQAMREAGRLPLRVTHNDTKLNNVLLHPQTYTPLCVLDLDTVMPGLSAYDFGDSIRFGAATAAEDEQDVSKMHLDIGLFEAFTQGFLEGAPGLTAEEVDVLPLGAFTMTLECGSRFLADYLNGDTYFRTHYPTHNLVRARTQIALCRDMLARWDEMAAVIARVR